MRKLNIGVFGGKRGQTMINILNKHPEARLAAVCDKYEPLLEDVRKTAEENGSDTALYTDFDSFIKHPGLDAVVLANYANEHAVYAVKCLRAGKHVLSEVLPCETMAQAVELIETVEETGLVYGYAENYCYMSHTFEMWKRYREGGIGSAVYGEGEYIHDCSGIWPDITYGERNHWRNIMQPNFYCTHSLGPLMAITGLRPVQVVGFETRPLKSITDQGCHHGGGIEMVTMENGAIFKSIHGGLKREPSSVNYELYCTKGMMESGRLPENKTFNMYTEGEEICKGEWEKYDASSDVAAGMREKMNITGHGGSDLYPTHCFIEKILGHEDGKWLIDVYSAVDMGICGILAYRSALEGNVPVRVPDLRLKEERDLFRFDTACTSPAVAGDMLLPLSTYPEFRGDFPDEVYDRVREKWLENEAKKR